MRGWNCAHCCASWSPRQRAAAAAAPQPSRRPPRGAPRCPVALVPAQPRHYETIRRWTALERWLASSAAAPLISFDAEHDQRQRLHERRARRLLLLPRSRAAPPTCRSATSIRAHPSSSTARACSRRSKPVLEDAARAKVGHHLKFDAHVLANDGITLAASDTMPCSSPTCSTASPPATTWTQCPALSRSQDHRYEDVAGKGAKQIRFNQVDGARRGLRRRVCRRHAAAASGAVAAARGVAAR